MEKPVEAVRAALEVYAEYETANLDPPVHPDPAPAFDFSMYTVKKPPAP